MPDRQLRIPAKQTRSATIEEIEIKEGVKHRAMSVSSATPYLRYDWFADQEYWEVLGHGPNDVDDERLKSGLPILFNHNRNAHLARASASGFKIEADKLTLDMEAFAWSESELAQEKRKDMESGVLIDTSVGYELLGDAEKIGEKDGKPILKFRWKPYEASLVTVPADGSVGVGRSREASESDLTIFRVKENGIDDAHKETNKPQTKSAMPAIVEPPTNETKPEINLAEEQRKAAEKAVADFQARCDKIDEHNAKLRNPAWRAKGEEIGKKHKKLGANFEEFRTELNNSLDEAEVIQTPHRGSGIEVIGNREHPLSIGAQFVRSKQFQAEGGKTMQRRSITIDTDMSVLGIRGKVSLAQRGAQLERAGFTSTDLTAINVAPMQMLTSLGLQRLTIMDLIAGGTTSAAAIPYPVEQTLGTVDGVAQTGGKPMGGMVGERGLKPLWEPDITTETANVKKIAITTKVPDEFLADFPAFQSFIDARLPYMVDTRAEQQILYGDGLGNNIKGITTFAGIQTRAYATTWTDTLRKGITDVGVGSFFEADGIVMHPYDWETASLEKDTNGQYVAGGPVFVPYGNGVYVAMRTFWGLPVVATTACTVGQPIVGCWRLGAQFFTREGMRIETTNANEDDFRRNLIAVRAEERGALAVYRPPCFLEVTGGPART